MQTVRAEVLPGWVDFNEHMSAPYHAVAFGECDDAALAHLECGADWRQSSGRTLFVVEARYRYRREIRAGESFRIETRLAAVDDKRPRLAHRMFRSDDSAAADADILFLHVAPAVRKAVPFDATERDRLATILSGTAPSEV